MKPLALSVELLLVRDTQRRLARHRGEPWPSATLQALMDVLRRSARTSGRSVLPLAADAAESATNDGQPKVALHFIAAAVELLDPTPKEAADVCSC